MRQEDGFVEGDGKRLVGGCTDPWLATAVGRVACLRCKQVRYYTIVMLQQYQP